MLKYLIIGDSHVPKRAQSVSNLILEKLDELTANELFEHTFFTGDLIDYSQFMEYLNLKTKKNLFVVIGNMDYYYGNKNAPVYQKSELILKDNNKLVIGLTHGAQIEPRGDRIQLEYLAKERGYNILISGHTHKEEIFLTKNSILLLNPGSVTGAWSFVASKIPSFIVMTLDEISNHIDISLYQLDKNTQQVKELKFYFIFENSKIKHRY
ncbi:MAG: YfcE family phosphodiesterase [Candidatus Hodarchaeota archaeon]